MVHLLIVVSFTILGMNGYASERAQSFWSEIDYGAIGEPHANQIISSSDNFHNESIEKAESHVFEIAGILLKSGTIKIRKNEEWRLNYLNQSGGILDIEGKLIFKIKDKMQPEMTLKGLRWNGRKVHFILQKELPVDPCIHFSHVIMHPESEIIFPESLLGKMQSYFR